MRITTASGKEARKKMFLKQVQQFPFHQCNLFPPPEQPEFRKHLLGFQIRFKENQCHYRVCSESLQNIMYLNRKFLTHMQDLHCGHPCDVAATLYSLSMVKVQNCVSPKTQLSRGVKKTVNIPLYC